jgi:hypothetical protein
MVRSMLYTTRRQKARGKRFERGNSQVGAQIQGQHLHGDGAGEGVVSCLWIPIAVRQLTV